MWITDKSQNGRSWAAHFLVENSDRGFPQVKLVPFQSRWADTSDFNAFKTQRVYVN